MRIAIFTNNYLPNPYGVPTSIETFRRDFEKLGHQVFIFAPHWPGYKDENPNVFRYPSLDINIKFRFPLAIPFSPKMDKIIAKLDLDIIHSQHPNLLGTAAKKWARKLACRRGGKKIPLVFTWHTLYDQYTNFVPFIPPRISAGFMIRKAVEYANEADAVVVPTDSIIPILRDWGVTKAINPIATGVVKEEFENADGKKIREKYNIADDEILLVLITRITAEKNVEFLFDALGQVLKKDKIKFLLGGDGYLMPKLKQRAKGEGLADKIIFSGVISHDEIKDYLAAGDIFVDASKSETQGMGLSEAMYSGLPVVAVAASGTNSLVQNNVNGILVSENKDEFSRAIEKLVADANLRQEMGEASKKIARENFTSDVCARKMLDLYSSAIKNSKSL
jgi:glycosyltransferase involved in cell wall biosynthesis